MEERTTRIHLSTMKPKSGPSVLGNKEGSVIETQGHTQAEDRMRTGLRVAEARPWV